jgi:SAM-dependent methyltransferase
LANSLNELIGLRPPARIADIGAGTGLSSLALLEAGFDVVAIEPNAAMRHAGEATAPQARWLAGTADATSLADASVDAWVAAQAFHWFDPIAARDEALRILRPTAAGAVLIWNQRRLSGSPFLEAYEALLLEFGTDYREVRHDHRDARRLDQFFGPAGYTQCVLENSQRLDREALLARLFSSSYTPASNHPLRAPMLSAANAIFDRHASAGEVTLIYDVLVLAGPMR